MMKYFLLIAFMWNSHLLAMASVGDDLFNHDVNRLKLMKNSNLKENGIGLTSNKHSSKFESLSMNNNYNNQAHFGRMGESVGSFNENPLHATSKDRKGENEVPREFQSGPERIRTVPRLNLLRHPFSELGALKFLEKHRNKSKKIRIKRSMGNNNSQIFAHEEFINTLRQLLKDPDSYRYLYDVIMDIQQKNTNQNNAQASKHNFIKSFLKSFMKRRFSSWAGKRSNRGRSKFHPLGGRRNVLVASRKPRKQGGAVRFSAWGGKRSVNGPINQQDDVLDSFEKYDRVFDPTTFPNRADSIHSNTRSFGFQQFSYPESDIFSRDSSWVDNNDYLGKQGSDNRVDYSRDHGVLRSTNVPHPFGFPYANSVPRYNMDDTLAETKRQSFNAWGGKRNKDDVSGDVYSGTVPGFLENTDTMGIQAHPSVNELSGNKMKRPTFSQWGGK